MPSVYDYGDLGTEIVGMPGQTAIAPVAWDTAIQEGNASRYRAITGLVGTATPLPAAPPPGVGLGAGAGVLGIPGAAAVVPAAGAALGLPAGVMTTLTGLVGTAGAIYGGLQALGLGEGGGLFGNNLLGGDDFSLGGVEFGGPGLAEPPAQYVLKEWHVSYDWGRLQYYLVQMPGQSRKIAMYNTRTKRWKVWVWRAPRLAVIGKNMPSHKMITRLRRNLKKHSADARTILKMTSPTSLASHSTGRRRRRR